MAPSNKLLTQELARDLTDGNVCRELLSRGRRSQGCWEIEKIDGTKRIIKVSRLDKDVLAINQQQMVGNIIRSSSHYTLPEVQEIRINSKFMLTSYEYIQHQNFKWSDFRQYSQGRRLALAAADFNTRNSAVENIAWLPKKEFKLGLNAKKLQMILPQQSEEYCLEKTNLAKSIYGALLEKASENNCFKSIGLAHNDLTPLNIGTTTNAVNEKKHSRSSIITRNLEREERDKQEKQESRKLLFLDLDNAVISPLGTDLRFFVFAVAAQDNRIKYTKQMAEIYHTLAVHRHSELSLGAVTSSAFLGYANAWLNLHRRTRSKHDQIRFENCLEFCQLALNEMIFNQT